MNKILIIAILIILSLSVCILLNSNKEVDNTQLVRF